jgi:hypothetical protein
MGEPVAVGRRGEMDVIGVFATACATTGGVLLTVAGGAIIVQKMQNNGALSLKGIAYITAMITLPCMLFTRLSLGFDEALLFEGWPVLVFGTLQISFGIVMAHVVVKVGILDEEYAPLATLAMCCQNAVSFPYSLLTSISSVSWFDGGAAVSFEESSRQPGEVHRLRGDALVHVQHLHEHRPLVGRQPGRRPRGPTPGGGR